MSLRQTHFQYFCIIFLVITGRFVQLCVLVSFFVQSGMAIDIEKVILLVQQRTVLWDKNTEEYKDRVKTRNAWVEISEEMDADYRN